MARIATGEYFSWIQVVSFMHQQSITEWDHTYWLQYSFGKEMSIDQAILGVWTFIQNVMDPKSPLGLILVDLKKASDNPLIWTIQTIIIIIAFLDNCAHCQGPTLNTNGETSRLNIIFNAIRSPKKFERRTSSVNLTFQLMLVGNHSDLDHL